MADAERKRGADSVKKQTMLVLLLAGWCLLFLRCETTEKSMVRAVYLTREEAGFRAGLLYQAPEAAADASEASAALQYVQAEGPTLERAIARAEDALPQAASYRLCDFALLPDADEALLSQYEQLVLRQGCGRTAARLACANGNPDVLTTQTALPDAVLSALKANATALPHLYQHRETILLPALQWEEGEMPALDGGILHTGTGNRTLTTQQTELFGLLGGIGGTHSFWLEGEKISIRRCSVSVTLKGEAVLLRLDCQRLPQSPRPTAVQQAQLAQECTVFVQECWAQGVDVLHLGAYAALQKGSGAVIFPTKNACPQLRTDVRFVLV